MVEDMRNLQRMSGAGRQSGTHGCYRSQPITAPSTPKCENSAARCESARICPPAWSWQTKSRSGMGVPAHPVLRSNDGVEGAARLYAQLPSDDLLEGRR